MSYHITVGYQPEGRYPFALNTEADQIPLTRDELEALRDEINQALNHSATRFQTRIKIIPIKEYRYERA